MRWEVLGFDTKPKKETAPTSLGMYKKYEDALEFGKQQAKALIFTPTPFAILIRGVA